MPKVKIAISHRKNSTSRRRVQPGAETLAKLRQVREDQGISQEALARILGSSWISVSRWERGQAQPADDAMKRVERFLELEALAAPALKPGGFRRFLTTPHPVLKGYPPSDLLQSGFGFLYLKEFVHSMLGGEYELGKLGQFSIGF